MSAAGYRGSAGHLVGSPAMAGGRVAAALAVPAVTLAPLVVTVDVPTLVSVSDSVCDEFR